MSVLGREAILAASDWAYDEFEVPKWGGMLRIRALSAGERLQLSKEATNGELEGEQAFRFFTRVIALSVVDAQNRLVFDAQADHEALLSKDWDTLTFVANRIMQFNGMGADAAEELAKN